MLTGHGIIIVVVLLLSLRSLGCRFRRFSLSLHIVIAVQASSIYDTSHIQRHIPTSLKQNSRLDSQLLPTVIQRCFN